MYELRIQDTRMVHKREHLNKEPSCALLSDIYIKGLYDMSNHQKQGHDLAGWFEWM